MIRDKRECKMNTDGVEPPLRDMAPEVDQQAAATQRLLAAIVESAGDAIFSETWDGTITSWNAAAERLLGYDAAEILGQSVTCLLPQDRIDEHRQILERLHRGESFDPIETTLLTRTGRSIDVALTLSPIRDSDGRTIGVSTIARDISGRKQSEAAVAALHRRVEADLAGMVYLHELNARLAEQDSLSSLLEEVLDAAMGIARTPMGSVQLYDQLTDSWQLVAHRGLGARLLECMTAAPEAPCAGAVLERGDRLVVEDVRENALLADSDVLEPLVEEGVQAMEVTPLISYSGRKLGVITTYYRTPQRSDGGDRRLLDLLARQAADFIERAEAEDAVERALDRLNLVLSSITDSYFALDSNYRFVEVNPAALQTIFRNLPASALLGREMWEVFPEGKWTEFYHQYHQAFEQQREVHFEARSAIVDRWFEVHAYPRNGRLEVYVRDITDRKRVEEEARAKAEALAEADRRKDQFLALLGHELRNPLSAIVSGMQVLARTTEQAPNTKAVLEIVERQTRHMRRLIDDLLDVSRITQGKITLRSERLDLTELIEKTVQDHRASFEESGCALEVRLPTYPLWVDGDPTRLAQALGNLLHNACKFTDPGGRVTVSAWEDMIDRGAVVAVRDTGIGMSPAVCAQVFQAFRQAETSVNRSRGGLGLGLALVKGLVELHHGRVTAKSDGPGAGSEFSFWLPLAPSAPSTDSDANQSPATRSPGSFRVLVVDDSPGIADLFAMLLRTQGHIVEVALSGEAALEMIREFRPEVVFSDISMPGMDGYELANHVRSQSGLRGLVLVALTGYAQREDRERALAAGFDYHLVKPLDLDTLEEFFANLCQERQANP